MRSVGSIAVVAAVLVVALAGGCRQTAPAEVGDQLPAAEEFSAELRARLRAALDAQPGAYVPRTRHRRPDGTPRFTNRLILERSPYLLQHAHNPVNWFSWGDEAFTRARTEGKPVFLSVGYSTCHWCHVMEEESFEDLEVAAYLNEHYVAIKVDREERPDIDDTYLTAVQLLTGNGGWPLNVWLTPARQPFFGGTYFPPRDGARGRGLLTVLRDLDDAYREHPLTIAQHATELTDKIRRVTTLPAGESTPGAAPLRRAFGEYRARFDATYGGFGGAPKFPTPSVLDFLLRYHRRTADPDALAMVTQTLAGMAAGGIYDQIGGGFHRYATDRAWRVPHFEKMLYDNALLAAVYLDAYRVTQDEDLARVARETLDAIGRDLGAPSGGFYAASDADSAAGEGKYFVWTDDELAATLEPTELAAVRAFYGVTADGNFDGANVLAVPRPLADVATDLGTTTAALTAVLATARAHLRATRATRPPPHVDTKILTGWNGLAISAFAKGGVTLGDPALVERARRAADRILDTMWDGTRLRRSDGSGAGSEAFLEDYAFLAAALVDLYEATFEPRWLVAALRLHDRLAAAFADEAGGFFLTGTDHEILLGRAKPADDGALPSGNAIAADTLLRLAELTGDDRYRERAAGVLRGLQPVLARTPASAPRLLGALEFFLDRPPEIVIVRSAASDERADRLLEVTAHVYLPNRALTSVIEGGDLARQQELVPLVEGKRARDGVATAYVCEARVCALPTSDPAVLARQLTRVQPLPADAPAEVAGAEHD